MQFIFSEKAPQSLWQVSLGTPKLSFFCVFCQVCLPIQLGRHISFSYYTISHPCWLLSPSTKWVTSPSPPLLPYLISLCPRRNRELRPHGGLLWRVQPELRLQVLLPSQLHFSPWRLHLRCNSLGEKAWSEVSQLHQPQKAEIALCCGVTPRSFPVPRPPGQQMPSRKFPTALTELSLKAVLQWATFPNWKFV